MSVLNDILSTYHNSISIRSSYVVLLLPLAAQFPVSPGVTLKNFSAFSPYFSSSSFTTGLGPINANSPFTMFSNCGNSSKLAFLKNFPTLVILGSFSNLKFSLYSFICSGVNCFINSSAFVTIVLYLYIFIVFPFFPILVCLKNTGPGESIFTASAIIK